MEVVFVALICVTVSGLDDDGGAHAYLGIGLIVALAAKVALVRSGRAGRLLPAVGVMVFALLAGDLGDLGR